MKVAMEYQKLKHRPRVVIRHLPWLDAEFCAALTEHFWFDVPCPANEFHIIKESASRGIRVYRVAHGEVRGYLKTYSYRRLDKKLENNLFRKPEGVRNLKIANRLFAAGIPTVLPLFSATRRKLLSRDSMVLSEEADGVMLAEFARRHGLSGNRRALEALGELWARLTRHRFVHKDPGIENIFIRAKGDCYHLTLVDIDNLFASLVFSKRLAERALARFLAKVYIGLWDYRQPPLSHEDMECFFKAFCDCSAGTFREDDFTPRFYRIIARLIIRRGWIHVVPTSEVLSAAAQRTR